MTRSVKIDCRQVVRSLTGTKEDGGDDVLTFGGTSGGGVLKLTSLIG
jgi:hypothetical protein